VKGASSEVDASFSDILDHLDLAVQVHLEARNGKWGLFLDPTYMKLSGDEDVSSARGVFGADVEVTAETWLVEFGGFYRVGEWPVGDDATRSLVFDVLAGGRYFYLNNEIEIEGTGPLGLDVDVDESKDWVDPIVGGRVFLDLSDKFKVGLRADVGGFDVGNTSDFAWNVLAALGYDLSENTTLWAGYRHLEVDYDDGSGSDLFVYDVEMSGPIVGMAIRF
ncbi:MAG: hypothetical protein HY801_07915, partial [Candidatus Lindowbacteria bacterium]|nr:hypothetical protein [Candidatus Lindowbacteria bacterium]